MSMYSYKSILYFLTLTSLNIVCSCNKFLETDVSKSQITKDVVFSNDATATSAVTGMYAAMYTSLSSFASGSPNSIAGLCGLSADELAYCPPSNPEMKSFETHNLFAPNSNIQALWSSMYFAIYGANNAIEGLNASSVLTPSIKNQLLGECLFVRAFAHFYLVNLFGAVPVVVSTDYKSNAKLSRTEATMVYEQIVEDLLEAQKNIGDNYPGAERTRPNKAAVTSFLSRVYLYMGHWEGAALEATKVIEDGNYLFVSNLGGVFLKNSSETIWQLRPSFPGWGANEAVCFVLTYSPFMNPASPFILTQDLLNAFEANDFRKDSWINTFDDGTNILHYPFKYKDKNPNQSEYSMVIRRSELFLIRSEARAKVDDLSGAMADLDSIRNRAGIPLISVTNPGISKEDLLLAIERERRVELFTEWGHRWFDLKRTGRADVVLQNKTGYKPTAKLYPIPQLELNKNPSLGDQNEGY